MNRPEEQKRLRSEYPNGTSVELLKMDDPQAPPAGTLGTVYGVDDTGSLLWCAGITVQALMSYLTAVIR